MKSNPKSATISVKPAQVESYNSSGIDGLYFDVTKKTSTDKDQGSTVGASAATTWTQFTQDTTFHGVKYIFEGTDIQIRRPLWAICVLVAIGVFMTRVVIRTGDFFKREASVGIQEVYNDSIILPSITLCNLNNFRITEVSDRNMYTEINDIYLQGINNIYGSEAFNDYSNEFSSIDTEDFILTTAHQLDDFIERCTFNGGDCITSDLFHRVLTDIGVCYTFNGGGINGQVFNTSNKGAGQTLTLVINVEQYEYMRGPQDDTGVKILLHDQGETPLMNDFGFSVSTGTHTFVALKRKETKSLIPPYGICEPESISQSNCAYDWRIDYADNTCNCTELAVKNGQGNTDCDLINELVCIPLEKLNADRHKEVGFCTVPCDVTTYEKALSYAQLSKFSIERSSLREGDGRKDFIKNRFENARETNQRVVPEKWNSDLNTFTTLINDYLAVQEISHNMTQKWVSSLDASQQYGFGDDPIWKGFDLSLEFSTELEPLLADKYTPNQDILLSVIDTDVQKGASATKQRQVLNSLNNLFALDYEPDSLDFLSVLKQCNQASYSTFSSIFPRASFGVPASSRLQRQSPRSASYSFLPAGSLYSFIGNHLIPEMSEFQQETCQKYLQRNIQLIKNLIYSPKLAYFDLFLNMTDAYDVFINTTYANYSFSDTSNRNNDICKRTLLDLKTTYPIVQDTIRSLKQIFTVQTLSEMIQIIEPIVSEFKNSSFVEGWTTVEGSLDHCLTWHDKSIEINGIKEATYQSRLSAQTASQEALNYMENIHIELAEINNLINNFYGPTKPFVNQYLDGNITKTTLANIFNNASLTTALGRLASSSEELKKAGESFREHAFAIHSVVLEFWQSVLVDVDPCFFIDAILESGFWKSFVNNSNNKDIQYTQQGFKNDSLNTVTLIIGQLFRPFTEDLVAEIDLIVGDIDQFVASYIIADDDLTTYRSEGVMDSRFYFDNFLKIDFYYESLSYTKVEHQISFNLDSLLSEVGGFLGLLLGASCLTVCEILDYVLISFFRAVRSKMRVNP